MYTLYKKFVKEILRYASINFEIRTHFWWGERGSLKLGPGSFMGPGEEKKSLL